MWDHDDRFDLRPLLIQDGQHRVRGGAISPGAAQEGAPGGTPARDEPRGRGDFH